MNTPTSIDQVGPAASGEGRVIFVGAGPGSADLITVRGARMLARADVVLFDALTDHTLRDEAPGARWINVGKRGYDHGTAQAHINALMVAHARRGLTVVRLKGGDPSVFGRLEEELGVMRAEGVPCEVVPGVTAALAAAAQTLRPLTRRGRGRTVSLTTAATREDTARAPTSAPTSRSQHRAADTEVFYMASHQLANLPDTLQADGWTGDAPALVVSQAGTPQMIVSQHTVASLADAAQRHAGLPTVVTVGIGATAIDVGAPTDRDSTTSQPSSQPSSQLLSNATLSPEPHASPTPSPPSATQPVNAGPADLTA